MRATALALLLLSACGAPAPPSGPSPSESREPPPEREALSAFEVPGSRLTLPLPEGAARVPHALRWRDPTRDLSIQVSDASVEPGSERTLAELGFARIRERAEGDVRARPVSFGVGVEGMELDAVMSARERLHVITVWREGAMARLAITHRPEEAMLVARIVDEVRLDPDRALDPLAALDLACAVPPPLTVVPVSNEQLLLRVNGHAVPFPSAEPALDVVFAPFEAGPPRDDRARGELLGARFAGLALDPPEVHRLEGAALPGLSLETATLHDGVELFVYGAYLEDEDGALLVRASVAAPLADEWRPRFEEVTRTLRPRR